MSINSRTKGASGERELAKALEKLTGVSLERNLTQSRNGGHDLLPDAESALGCFASECKRYASSTLALRAKWWAQAVSQAERIGKLPALCYRADRQPWRVILPMGAINSTFNGTGFDRTADISIDAFAALICRREG